MAEKYNECVLVLSQDGGMSDFLLYTLGLRDQMELDDMIKALQVKKRSRHRLHWEHTPIKIF